MFRLSVIVMWQSHLPNILLGVSKEALYHSHPGFGRSCLLLNVGSQKKDARSQKEVVSLDQGLVARRQRQSYACLAKSAATARAIFTLS